MEFRVAPATSTFHFSCLFASVSQITGSLGFSLIRNHLLSPSDPNVLWGNRNAGALLFCFICFQSLQMEVVTCKCTSNCCPRFSGDGINFGLFKTVQSPRWFIHALSSIIIILADQDSQVQKVIIDLYL